jgi:hypothetical protein
MPAMPRVKDKATKIAYRILGKPLNLQPNKEDKKQRKVRERLLFEETWRVR